MVEEAMEIPEEKGTGTVHSQHIPTSIKNYSSHQIKWLVHPRNSKINELVKKWEKNLR